MTGVIMFSLLGRPRAVSMLATASVAALVASVQPAAAQQQTRAFNIEPQALSSALIEFSAQSDVRVIADPALINGRRSPGVIGSFSPDDALSQLLAGTGLRLSRNSGGGLTVIADTTSPTQLGANNRTAPSEDGEDLVVTGTRLNRAVSGFPVNSYTQETLDRSGQPDLGRFLSTLNEVSITSPASGPAAVANRNATVQLRGLPIGTTLSLVNGRRVQASSSASGALVFDLNSIPFSAIERVDVVPVGSSAIYGGDALAGVVNVVLRHSFDGVALNANLGLLDGAETRGLSFAAGRSFERGSLMAIGAWNYNSPLRTTDRDFFLDADYTRYGGPDGRVRQCTPGTVTNAGAGNLPGLSSNLAGIPDLASGVVPTIGDFTGSAGSPNLCGPYSEGYGAALVHESETLSFHVAGDYQLTSGLTAFGEISYSRDDTFAPANAILLNNVLVPASNAFNPFGVDVRVTTMLDLENGATGPSRDTEFMRVLAGLRGDLGSDWDFEATIMRARDESESITLNTLVSSAARTAALASADPATALNPFTNGRAASETVLRGIWADAIGRIGESQHDQFSIFARGDVANLWAGPLSMVVGGEAARDIWITSGPGFSTDGDRRTEALFAEANLPLLRSSSADGAGRELATLSLAGRWDSFSDFGEATTYQAGLELHPLENLHVRLATATSFKPPSLLQLNGSETIFPSELLGLRDPARGNEAIVGADVVFGGAANLEAETGEATTFGVTWEPEFISGLRLSATSWNVDIEGLISQLPAQTALDFESLFPYLVTREPSVGGVPGQVTRVGYQFVNFGSVSVSGVDMDLAYARSTSLGQVSFTASASHTNEYESLLTPGVPIQDRLGRRFLDFWAPEWKGRVSLALDAGDWRVGGAGRYVGPYLDEGVSTRELGDIWTYDVWGGINLFSERTQLLVTIANVTDELPSFAGTAGLYFDHTQGDWRGRYTSVRLSTTW